MWCRHGLVYEALKDSGTGLYFKGVNTTFVNFFFFRIMIMACHWYLVFHFPVILVNYIACLNFRL